MVYGVHSIRVFSQFSLDPYYEPLPWFMMRNTVIYFTQNIYGSVYYIISLF